MLAGCAWYLSKLVKHQKDAWVSFTNLQAEMSDANKRSAEILAFLKLTFNKDFAKKVEDVIRIKENTPPTVKILCDDGKWHDLPEDRGF
jgi:hypothetical protein